MLTRALFIAMAVAAPVQAQQSVSWINQCVPSVFNACASFWLTAEYDVASTGPLSRGFQKSGPGYTRITFGMANLQGTGVGLPESGSWLLQGGVIRGMEWSGKTAMDRSRPGFRSYGFSTDGTVTFERPSTPSASLETAPAYCRIREGPVCLSQWESALYNAEIPERVNGGPEDYVWFGTPYTVNAGIAGCQRPAYDGVFSTRTVWWYRACGTEVFISWDLPGNWAITDRTRIEWSGISAMSHSGTATRLRCTTGVDCRQEYAVPEPGTYLLLLTGVLGMGLVGIRRRGLSSLEPSAHSRESEPGA